MGIAERSIAEHASAANSTTDTASVRERYRIEREKRLRPDGKDQYLEVAGEFAHFGEDPYTRRVERDALHDDVTVALIGGGFAGLVLGARLVQAGLDDVRIIEKGGDVGGTWYWNRYPGAQCDVESYVYLPFLEETGYVPTEKYAHAPEIHEHCRRIARHFGLYDNACLSTEVTGVKWDESQARWIIRTDRGDEMRARFVVMGTGPLQRPKLPGIDGIASFGGHSFHTSRWDFDYTGGDSNGGLDALADKRVAVIGTGATAVQVVPHLARSAQELFVFQRTPSSIDTRGNRPTDPDWVAGLEPGWQQRRIENFTALTSGGLAPEDLVMDGWTDFAARVVTNLMEQTEPDLSPEAITRALRASDDQKMGEIRERVDQIVTDQATAEALKPWYRFFCKRPCFHDEYLQAYNRPNVHLVDTDGKGVDRISETGLVVGGVEYGVDCIIYATGFEVGTDYTRRSGFDVTGRTGETLSEHWANGVRSMHGMHVHGFPNMFVVGHQQAGFTVSYPHLLDEAAKHLTYLVGRALAEGIDSLEATPEAEAAWVDTILTTEGMRAGFGAIEDCTPGYYNNEGQPSERGRLSGFYPGGPLPFFNLIAEWRSAGDMAGLEVRS